MCIIRTLKAWAGSIRSGETSSSDPDKAPGSDPKKTPGSDPNPVSSSKGLTYLFLTLIMALSIYLLIYTGKVYDELKIHPPYLMLAIIGVIFHMTSKMREMRDSGQSFNIQQYWFDYVFRAFQACIYVFIITNLLNTESVERVIPIQVSPENLDKLKQALDDSIKQSIRHVRPHASAHDAFSYKLALLSLFTGMYIRRVEEAFVSFGDTFGNSISAVLGSGLPKLLPDEKLLKKKKIHSQFLDIKDAYEDLTPRPDDEWRLEFEKDLAAVREHLDQGRLDAAAALLLNLELRLNEYERSREKSSGPKD